MSAFNEAESAGARAAAALGEAGRVLGDIYWGSPAGSFGSIKRRSCEKMRMASRMQPVVTTQSSRMRASVPDVIGRPMIKPATTANTRSRLTLATAGRKSAWLQVTYIATAAEAARPR